jgi:D-tyrosyl-tRNA(Tyr) deacylase
VDYLSLELVEHAKEMSGASCAYIGRESLKSPDRTRMSEILREVGIEPLKGNGIRAAYPLKDKMINS